jgi:vitamin B12 transporter
VHNESFGDRGVPRAALSYLLRRGGEKLSETRLRGSYAQGFKEPTFYDTLGFPPFSPPNPNLKPEQNRAFEAGVSQSLLRGKYSLDAVYFNNLFHDKIDYDPLTFQAINIDKALAHGAEVTAGAHPLKSLQVQAAYVYTSTQVLEASAVSSLVVGGPLLHRPKHSGSLLASYTRRRFGATLGGTFIGRRADESFGISPPITHAAGYARFDAGGWYTVNRHITAYAKAENLLNQHYNDVVGYPGLRFNFRAGMRFSFGGDRTVPASN